MFCRALAIVSALAGAACNDYGALERSYCASAKDHGVAFCDGFDGRDVDGRWITQIDPGSAATPEPDDKDRSAYMGAQALHVSAGRDGSAFLMETTATATLTKSYALRMFMYVADPLPGSALELASLLDSGGEPIARISLVDGVPVLDDGAGGHTTSLVDRLGSGFWACAELLVSIDAPIDGKSAIHRLVRLGGDTVLRIDEASPPVSIGSTRLGLGHPATGGPAASLWLDEVAIDESPVGCAP